MDTSSLFLSVIVPAYNEGTQIGGNIAGLTGYLDARGYAFEIIIVDDGSTDSTGDIISGISKYDSRIKLIINSRNKGKGYSTKKGIMAAAGRFILFTDADCQIYFEELEKFIELIASGCDIVIASRLLPGAELHGRQSLFRAFSRKVLSFLVKSFLMPDITDSQCGFKCFSRQVAETVFRKQTITGFGFDIEILYIAYKAGYNIKEVPISWKSSKTTKVRLIPDSIGVLKDIIKIKIKSILSKY
ncbi:MAG: glycosyltransferase family 2 protein [Elusimicrobia bacterium]|nr:glycosyltransferase family 2 protein [Elusimicrobiota bacterium]